MIARPPTAAEWLVDGLTFGHTPAEVVAYMGWCADYADQEAGRVADQHAAVVAGFDGIEAPRRGWRRLFGRSG